MFHLFSAAVLSSLKQNELKDPGNFTIQTHKQRLQGKTRHTYRHAGLGQDDCNPSIEREKCPKVKARCELHKES